MLSKVAPYVHHLVFYFLWINANLSLLYIDYEVSLPEPLPCLGFGSFTSMCIVMG